MKGRTGAEPFPVKAVREAVSDGCYVRRYAQSPQKGGDLTPGMGESSRLRLRRYGQSLDQSSKAKAKQLWTYAEGTSLSRNGVMGKDGQKLEFSFLMVSYNGAKSPRG